MKTILLILTIVPLFALASPESADLDAMCRAVKNFDFEKYGGKGSPQTAVYLGNEIDRAIQTQKVRNIWGSLPEAGWAKWDLIQSGAFELGVRDFECDALKEYVSPTQKNPAKPEQIKRDLEAICKLELHEHDLSAEHRYMMYRVNGKARLNTQEAAQFWDEIKLPRDTASYDKFVARAKQAGIKDSTCPQLKKYFTE
jgi:hypothetical protein